ncbi:MAG: hypothetical protein JWN11_504 [Hyphomicrobiales bacterium]|nr:hypothetical protein [Hyphomicrobiales bacterium]
MFASLERLRKTLSRPSHAYRASTESFADLDPQRIADEMELVKKGKRRGEKDQPPAEPDQFDPLETEIVELVGAAQKRAHDQLENQLAGFRQRLIDLDFEAHFAAIKTLASAGLSDLQAELQKGLNELHGLRRDLQEAEVWRDKFRLRNRIERPAHIPSATSTTFKWLLIIALVFIELLVNGELLSKNNALGLVGGILEAVIFAALNVGVALLFAVFIIPQLNRRYFFWKLVGLIGFLVYLGLAIGLNLSLAHYREVAGTLVTGAGETVLRRLQTAPLQLTDFRSWLLFGIGMLFSIVAMIDGLYMRDVHPGYAGVEKHVRKVRDAYRERQEYLIEELQNVRSDYDDELSEARADLSKQRTEHDAIVANRNRLLQLFEQQQAQLERAQNLLLSTYRDANSEARRAPPPQHFGEDRPLKRIEVQIGREGEWNSEELKRSIAQAQLDIDQLALEMGKQFTEALKRYRDLDTIIPDKNG